MAGTNFSTGHKLPPTALPTAYVVAAPRRADDVAVTLQTAYPCRSDTVEAFAELIARLDTITTRSTRR